MALDEDLALRRFAAAVDALEDDEDAALRRSEDGHGAARRRRWSVVVVDYRPARAPHTRSP
jgi:hypothetical protein